MGGKIVRVYVAVSITLVVTVAEARTLITKFDVTPATAGLIAEISTVIAFAIVFISKFVSVTLFVHTSALQSDVQEIGKMLSAV